MTNLNTQEADPEETARYIGRLAREMRQMAAKANLGFLAYLLAMVEDDADAAAREHAQRKQPPDST